jgi:spore photoproduct lyase
MRYFKPLRIALYEKMVQWIREAAPQVTVYFCMEDEEVWETATGFVPDPEGGLGRMLDESVEKVCDLVTSS